MRNPWQNLLLTLGRLETTVIAQWSMSNGSVFWLAVPKVDRVLQNSYSDDVEFPFTFSEILRLTIPQQMGQGKIAFTNDLESIYKVITGFQGLNITYATNRISISKVTSK